MCRIQKWLRFCDFLERETTFSPGFREIGLSDFFGPRRKTVLRGDDNTWTPVLRSFGKLYDVRVSSYLFYSWFKCFVDVCVGLRP